MVKDNLTETEQKIVNDIQDKLKLLSSEDKEVSGVWVRADHPILARPDRSFGIDEIVQAVKFAGELDDYGYENIIVEPLYKN